MPAADAALARLVAESAIRDALARYARGADRNDVELIRSAYHPDARDSHGYFSGTIDGFVEWFRERHAVVTQSMHFLGNCLIEFDGDEMAFVETYCQAFQRLRDPATPGTLQDLHVLCRYLDHFERRDGRWAIAARTVVYETQDVREVTDTDPFPAGFTVQVHGPADPLHVQRQTRSA
jgi:hypothetical protein